jgi:hypothetical protein
MESPMLEQWQQEFIDKLTKVKHLGKWSVSTKHRIRCDLPVRKCLCPLEVIGSSEVDQYTYAGDFISVAKRLGYPKEKRNTIVGAADMLWPKESPRHAFRAAILKAVGLPEE